MAVGADVNWRNRPVGYSGSVWYSGLVLLLSGAPLLGRPLPGALAFTKMNSAKSGVMLPLAGKRKGLALQAMYGSRQDTPKAMHENGGAKASRCLGQL